jgi:hypothetical protein
MARSKGCVSEGEIMKLCKDCKHFRAPLVPSDITEYAKCTYGMETSPVTGVREVKTQSSSYCINVRQSKNLTDCGPTARFFECANWLDPDDKESVIRCGDEGRLCDTCSAEAQKEHEYLRGMSRGAALGVMSEEEKQDLRDAGRGHLLP